jgi:hypothetical protein
MALRTQNHVWHYLLPAVSPHEDNVRDAGCNIQMSRAGLRGRLGELDGVRIGRINHKNNVLEGRSCRNLANFVYQSRRLANAAAPHVGCRCFLFALSRLTMPVKTSARLNAANALMRKR